MVQQREIGWRDMFSFQGQWSMTPLTEAHLAEFYCSDKRAEWIAAIVYGGEVGVGLELSAWSLLGEGCSSTDFLQFSTSESLSAILHVRGVRAFTMWEMGITERTFCKNMRVSSNVLAVYSTCRCKSYCDGIDIDLQTSQTRIDRSLF